MTTQTKIITFYEAETGLNANRAPQRIAALTEFIGQDDMNNYEIRLITGLWYVIQDQYKHQENTCILGSTTQSNNYAEFAICFKKGE